MDRRSFLAIALTFVILLGWQILYVAPRQEEAARLRSERLREKEIADSLAALQQPEEPVERPEEEPAETEAVRDETEPVPAFGEDGSGPEPVDFTVRTGKMEVVLSGRGAMVKDISLLDYARKDGSMVRIVPEESIGGLDVSVEKDGRWQSFYGRSFRARVNGRDVIDGEVITLGEQLETADVSFTLKGPEGEFVEKRLVFSRDGYDVQARIVIEREGYLSGTGSYALSWDCGIAMNEKDEGWEKRQMAALGKVGDEFYKESLGKFSKTDRKEQETGTLVWAGARSKYFLSAVIADEQRSGVLALLGDKNASIVGYSMEYAFRGDPRRIEDSYTCYFGPLDMNLLREYGVGLENTIDLGKLRFFSAFVLRFMMWMNGFIPNYGVIIILMSVMTKILFYRLTHKSFKSMKDMQRLQPKIKEIQEKYKNDRDKLNQETMKLYKEAGVNPLGGCLPLLLQMPVFFALFSVLRNTIELRNAPFALWINDLSSPDVLFDFGVSIPLMGSEFHLLPLLMGGAMILQSKMGASPTGEAGPAAQTKMMQTMMPIMMMVFFYGMPSGLVLYWIVNNILTIIQQYYVHRVVDAEEAQKKAAQAGT